MSYGRTERNDMPTVSMTDISAGEHITRNLLRKGIDPMTDTRSSAYASKEFRNVTQKQITTFLKNNY